MNGNVGEGVNITDNINNNVVNIIVNNLFADQAMVDTGCFGSLVDFNFCKIHNLPVILLQSGELKSYVAKQRWYIMVPLQFGESRSYVAAGETRITAIGLTNLVLTFAGERFPHNF